MNTPQWMTDAPAHAPQRAKPARHNRRSTDRRTPRAVDLALAFLAMAVTMWGIYELNSLMLR
jgi:hypothetical protein